MKEIEGDLIALALAGRFDLIVHGCNCFCAMGAGIALQIRDRFPQVYEADLNTQSGDRSKLGTYSSAQVTENRTGFTVINGYTQFHFSGQGRLADYGAIEQLFTKLKADFPGVRMGYPKIGAGLAGGNWDTISGIIDTALDGEDHTLVLWPGRQKRT